MAIEIISQKITINDVGTTELVAYLSHPVATKPRGAVIVGMELFGLTPYICNVTDRLAKEGYLAIAPDFYHRIKPGSVLDYDQKGRTEGFKLLHQISRENALVDVHTAMQFLRKRSDCNGKIGFFGLSIGGHIGYLCTSQLNIAASSIFYAGWLNNTDIPMSQPEPTLALTPGIAQQNGTLLYLVGARDQLINPPQQEAIRYALEHANVNHEMIVYPEAEHGFFCEDRETFNQNASDDAWRRSLALFTATLND